MGSTLKGKTFAPKGPTHFIKSIYIEKGGKNKNGKHGNK